MTGPGPVDPFGPEAGRRLAGAADLLEASVTPFIDAFYEDLGDEPGPSAVLARLSPQEVAHLKERQAEHLMRLVDPALTAEEVAERGRRVGRIHAMVGVELDWYAAAHTAYHRGVLGLLGAGRDNPDPLTLYEVLGQRLMHDVQGVVSGYRDMYAAQSRVMVVVSRAMAQSDTVADLARSLLDALSGLDGFLAGSFGRPDADGRFQFEVGVGAGVEAFVDPAPDVPPISTHLTDVAGRGPTGRAWRGGAIEVSDSYTTDPTTAPWHEIGRRNGWRASAAVPLAGPAGRPRAMLNVYAAWPGYFSSPTRIAFLAQLKQVVEPALARLEARDRRVAARVTPHATRRASLSRLAAGDVVMEYQPVVELASGRALTLEALARLRDGDRILAPADFLPAMGDRELRRLFELGLDRALEALAGWEAAGHVLGVSVNLPTTCIGDPSYVAIAEKALRRHAVAPSRLTLELLETATTAGDPRWHGQILGDLRALGVRLVEDDLGSGHSSLLRLQSITFDGVKVDQALVRGTERAPREGLAFIGPLTALAHGLGLHVVVEGLETPGLVEAAIVLGADAGQGYALARPMPPEAVPGWVAARSPTTGPRRPATVLGGLAAHLAWEQRLAAVRPSPELVAHADREPCPLADVVARLPDAARIGAAHRELHEAARDDLGGDRHRRAWERLALLLRQGA